MMLPVRWGEEPLGVTSVRKDHSLCAGVSVICMVENTSILCVCVSNFRSGLAKIGGCCEDEVFCKVFQLTFRHQSCGLIANGTEIFVSYHCNSGRKHLK